MLGALRLRRGGRGRDLDANWGNAPSGSAFCRSLVETADADNNQPGQEERLFSPIRGLYRRQSGIGDSESRNGLLVAMMNVGGFARNNWAVGGVWKSGRS